ncbi:murein biosynthesis integral membrane protein MurJ [Streptosporangium roseum]|uniref:Membrane protein putative virulence factor-like protein n=1 Tax=Streptosporangium roseum (strain ATCC 12428 / DSM 43021 / JCM 3005 / KCTC 9067 / NCIMB 10171 / NRRL 2505 / NI 9100) TaxID=479432 RepID=D2ASL8_STRRD|nr:murein biosynthesis integral membrane protein MurJ [Streptosporangium roseum]ACZ88541.1 membrane protein putative virulence factor-like protein [Streptosporangium roseum DSM 43021]
MTEQPRLIRTGRRMALATLTSRVTGFLRTLALVVALGLGTRLLDAYTVANTTPNTIYELVLGGTLAGVMIPLLIRAAAEPGVDSDLHAQRLLSAIVYVLGATVVLTVAAAPWIVDLYAPGFSPEQRDLAILLTRYFLPQILLYGLGTGMAAVLNARGDLATPMWAPVANNVVVIATALGYVLLGGGGELAALTPGQSLLLSLGTTAGVAVQTLVLAAALRRNGFPLRLRLDPRGAGLRRTARMAGWTLLYVIAAQAVFTVGTRLASGAGPGPVAVYQNAYTLFQLPYAVIAVSVITGVLPRMSAAAGGRDLARITADLSHGLRLTAVVLMPVAAALVVLGPQITTLLFAHGNASADAARLTGSVLAAFGFALVPFAGYQIMLRVFYALQDTRTPALIHVGVAVVAIASSVALSSALPARDLLVGLAACYAAAHAVGFAAAAAVLRHRLGRIDGHRLLRSHSRMLAASLAAGGAGALVAYALRHGGVAGAGWSGSLVTVLAVSAVGAGLYALVAHLLRVPELRTLVRALRPGTAAG